MRVKGYDVAEDGQLFAQFMDPDTGATKWWPADRMASAGVVGVGTEPRPEYRAGLRQRLAARGDGLDADEVYSAWLGETAAAGRVFSGAEAAEADLERFATAGTFEARAKATRAGVTGGIGQVQRGS